MTPAKSNSHSAGSGRGRPVRAFLETLPPYLARIVVGDLHGDLEGLRALLAHIGAVDRFGKRVDGFHILQLGDLVHAGHGEAPADRRILEEVLERGWLDEVLCGNHELFPAFGIPSGRWNGMTDPPDKGVVELLRQLHRQGGLTAASALDGWLCTHGGLHPIYQRRRGAGHPASAADLATFLCTEFELRIRDQRERDVFDAVGPVRSAGRDLQAGGIFWADAAEMEAATPRTMVPQIFGHSPQGDVPAMLRADMWCVDVGAALSGLVRPGEDVRRGWLGACGGAVTGRPAAAESVMDSELRSVWVARRSVPLPIEMDPRPTWGFNRAELFGRDRWRALCDEAAGKADGHCEACLSPASELIGL